MDLLYSQLRGHAVVLHNENIKIASVFDLAFDYEKGLLLAVLIKKFEIFYFEKLLILPHDIENINTKSLRIRDAESLSYPRDVIRLREIFDVHFSLMKIPVITESGVKLGNIVDCLLKKEDLRMKKLCIKTNNKSLHKMKIDYLWVSYKDILFISPKQIVIADIKIKEEAELKYKTLIPKLKLRIN